MQRLAERFVRVVFPGLKEDLLKGLDNVAIMPARYSPLPPAFRATNNFFPLPYKTIVSVCRAKKRA